MNTHLKSLTLPRTRAAVSRLYQSSTWARLAFWWSASLVWLAVYAQLRGAADEGGMPVHGAGMERAIFGSLPTLWLQRHVFTISPNIMEDAAVAVHTSWFFVPPAVALFISWRRPAVIGSFFRWWISLEAAAVFVFFLFPMEPPWMADPSVTRIIALRFGDVALHDPNPLAAMPSLHVAFPLLIAVWFYRERWWRPAAAMFTYAAVIAFEVVFAGEHYIVDVIGAGLLVAAIALVARIDAAQFARRALSAAAAPAALWRRLPRRVPVPAFTLDPVAIRQKRERGQALIEFAFIFPIILVLLLSLVDFGIAVDHLDVIQHAVREWSRSAAVGNSLAAVQSTTANESQGLLATTDVSMCYQDKTGNANVGDVGDNVKVSVSYAYKFSIGGGELLHAFGAGVPTIDLSTSANSRLEQAIPGANAC